MRSGTIGLDVSEDGVIGVVLGADGRVLHRARAEAGDAIAKVVKELLGAAGATGIGVAVDPSANLAGPRAGNAFGTRTIVESTPAAAAIAAETWIGKAQGVENAICLWLGSRVFAGMTLGGKPWTGAHGAAGSIAWLALNPVERQDYRRLGSLAAEVSTGGIARRLSWRIQSGDASAVLARAGTIAAITAADVFEGARSGDGVSISVVRETAKYLAMAIANLAAAIDPEVIVIAGELSEAGDLLMEPITQECARRLPPPMLARFRVELSTLGSDGIAIGAARLASAT